jgi:hypothetical protein
MSLIFEINFHSELTLDKERRCPMAAKAIKVVLIKKGRLVLAHSQKARVFSAVGKADNYVRNLCRVSNNLTKKDFEYVRFE